MNVNYSGWTEQHGSFSCNIFVDENRQDYELVFGNGSVAKQQGPFEEVTADWNNDGDVYTQFGAWFSRPEGNGGDFWTPVDMVAAVVDAQTRERKPYGNEVVSVKGIEVPLPGKRPALTDVIRQSEQRAANQEAERNRRMDALGIRPSDEPWAR